MEKAMVGLVEHIDPPGDPARTGNSTPGRSNSVMREALKLLPMGVGNVRLYINPQDFEQVKALRERHEETWRIVEDESAAAGWLPRRDRTQPHRRHAWKPASSQIMAQLFDQVHEQALHPAAARHRCVDLDAVRCALIAPASPNA